MTTEEMRARLDRAFESLDREIHAEYESLFAGDRERISTFYHEAKFENDEFRSTIHSALTERDELKARVVEFAEALRKEREWRAEFSRRAREIKYSWAMKEDNPDSIDIICDLAAEKDKK